MNTRSSLQRRALAALTVAAAWLYGSSGIGAEKTIAHSGRTVVVEVAAFNQPFMVNRFGASVPGGQIYALLRDLKFIDTGKRLPNFHTISNELFDSDPVKRAANRVKYFGPQDVGNVTLMDYKRPRPICLRANVGDVVEVRFVNLLTKSAGATPWSAQPFAGFHITGLALTNNGGIKNDSSFVGKNPDSFADNSAGQTGVQVYRYFADAEGVFMIYSQADPSSVNELLNGLFGCITVQPPGAEYYRSQVTREDLLYATLATQVGRDLPPNMLLQRASNPERPDVWTLTTFDSRRRRHALEAVPVVIRPPTEQLVAGIAPSVMKQELLDRNMATGNFTLSKNSMAEISEQKAAFGTENPSGFLYAAETPDTTEPKHPLIDYSITYPADYHAGGQGDARVGSTPVLRMLYPVAKSILPAQQHLDASDANTAVAVGDPSYEIKKHSPENPAAGYGPAIETLDTGGIPPGLETILKAWNILITPETKVAVVPERSYVSEVSPLQFASLSTPPKFPIKGYIWLVSGVTVNKTADSSIIIQGEMFGPDNDKRARLYFLEAEQQLFHTDPTAIITGPQAGRFPLGQDSRSFAQVPAEFDRRQPYREFALAYHNPTLVQSFPQFTSAELKGVLGGGTDGFAINYGIAGIGAEILANRLGVGPGGVNGDEVDLKFEEFFLSAWSTGDPAMLVDRPANASDQAGLNPGAKGNPAPRAQQVFFPDDPSNVYHSYLRDHVKMRIYNVGPNIPHVHHLHAHQWLRSPNSDEGAYLDSQLIVPGSAFSLEMVYGGSGNRNQTVGDSIFHCHFYTHFAKGMWSLWRVHDVFEDGTLLDCDRKVRAPDLTSDDPKLAWVRALPDGEIHNGSPIPAIVPMPTLGIAPFPARVRLTKLPKVVNPPGGNVEELAGKDHGWVNVEESMGRVVQVEPEYQVQLDEHGKKKDGARQTTVGPESRRSGDCS